SDSAAAVRDGNRADDAFAFDHHAGADAEVQGVGPAAGGDLGGTRRARELRLGPHRKVLRESEVRLSDSDDAARMAATERRSTARDGAEDRNGRKETAGQEHACPDSSAREIARVTIRGKRNRRGRI